MIIGPDEIDDLTVPIPAPHVALLEMEEGGLLVDEEAGRAYPVNATASLVWKLLNSGSPIGDLIDEVSDTFGESRSEIAAAVHGLMRTFGELGLFENVLRSFASLPVDIEYVDLDECGEPVQPDGAERFFDERYLTAPPNA